MTWREGWVLVTDSYSTTRNWINSVPQTAVTTFVLSSVYILLQCMREMDYRPELWAANCCLNVCYDCFSFTLFALLTKTGFLIYWKLWQSGHCFRTLSLAVHWILVHCEQCLWVPRGTSAIARNIPCDSWFFFWLGQLPAIAGNSPRFGFFSVCCMPQTFL